MNHSQVEHSRLPAGAARWLTGLLLCTLVVTGLALSETADAQVDGVSAEFCRERHSAPAGDFVTVPRDTDGNGVTETCVLDNYFGADPGVGTALKRLQAAHLPEYQCHLNAVLTNQTSNCPPAAAASLASPTPLQPTPPSSVGHVHNKILPTQSIDGVSVQFCRERHSAPAGDFVTIPRDTDGNGVAETCVLDNYFGSDPGVGTALKRLQAAHLPEYQCHLNAVLTNQTSNCPQATATPEALPGSVPLVLGDLPNGNWLRWAHPQLADEILDIAWVRDGVTPLETEVVQDILFIAAASTTAAQTVLNFSWVRDGITPLDADATGQIYWMIFGRESVGLKALNSPFLQTLESQDVHTLATLSGLSSSDLSKVLSHPTLAGGITDEWAHVITVAGGSVSDDSDLINSLLNPDVVTLETRSITLPLAGDTVLGIVRIRPHNGVDRTMDILEAAVRNTEALMGIPFPTTYVALLIDNGLSDRIAGRHFGTHAALLSKYDQAEEDPDAAHIIAHEVAHYYWITNNLWINEGIADLLAVLSENIRVDAPIETTTLPCADFSFLTELELANQNRGTSTHECNYSLGNRLFLDLYLTLGSQQFTQGLQNLYIQTTKDRPIGVDDLRAAFNVTSNDLAHETISRWYNGPRVGRSLSTYSDQPLTPLPVSLGQIVDSYISIGSGDLSRRTSSVTAAPLYERLYFTLEYDLLTSLPDPPTFELVEYFGDGFAFSRREIQLATEPGKWTRWTSVGTSATARRAPGTYLVVLYLDGQKVAEASYQVTP